jgi:hypothetical protein
VDAVFAIGQGGRENAGKSAHEGSLRDAREYGKVENFMAFARLCRWRTVGKEAQSNEEVSRGRLMR